MSTGERLKLLRTERGMTQKELAEALSLSLDMIKSLEQNRTSLSVENLKRISDFFNCTTDYLLGRTENPNMMAIESWDDFHRYMELAISLVHTIDKTRAIGLRYKMKKYPKGNEEIPDSQKDEVLDMMKSVVNVK